MNKNGCILGCGCLVMLILAFVFFSFCLTGFIVYHSLRVVPDIVHEIPRIPRRPKRPDRINIPDEKPVKPKPNPKPPKP